MARQGSAVDDLLVSDLGPEEEIPLGSSIPIRVIYDEGIPAQYANLLTVNFDRAAFQVIFSQAMQPVVLSDGDARRIVDAGYFRANLIARLIFTPLMVEQTINILQSQLDQFRQQQDDASHAAIGDNGG